MASDSAFNKRLTAETTLDKVEGLLEHFNLPPRTIRFIRANLRLIQFAIAVLVAAIVFWSLYSSYRDRQREEGASALSKAMIRKPGQPGRSAAQSRRRVRQHLVGPLGQNRARPSRYAKRRLHRCR